MKWTTCMCCRNSVKWMSWMKWTKAEIAPVRPPFRPCLLPSVRQSVRSCFRPSVSVLDRECLCSRQKMFMSERERVSMSEKEKVFMSQRECLSQGGCLCPRESGYVPEREGECLHPAIIMKNYWKSLRKFKKVKPIWKSWSFLSHTKFVMYFGQIWANILKAMRSMNIVKSDSKK